MSGGNLWLFVLVLVLILAILPFCLAIGWARDSRAKKRAAQAREAERAAVARVQSGSKRLNGIISLYSIYESRFNWNISPIEDYVSCSTRAQAEHYGGVKLWKHVVEYASTHKDDLLRRFKLAEQNKAVYLHYSAEYAQLESPTFDGELGKIESLLCERYTLNPEREISLVVHVGYVSPAGRSSYHFQYPIGQEQLSNAINQAERVVSEHERRKRERAKVTPKLRYRVLERDHFRCVHCGASAADGAKLHVDHIIPVSRGGKTVMSNLQTLCDACNLGKGSDMPAEGAEG